MSDIQQRIREVIEANHVVIFMNGSKTFPQDSSSSRAIEIINHYHVGFKDVNVLSDPAMRNGIKTYSNWPTIPLIYINGEFVGGIDTLLELHAADELQAILNRST